MKKTIISAIIMLLSLVSCSDFLKENPTTNLTDESAFDSELSLEAHLNSLYDAVYTYADISIRWLAYCSPLVHWKSYSREGLAYQQCLEGSFIASQTTGRGVISGQYSNIYTCNALLEGLVKSPVDEGYKKEVEAEARFIRAFCYFHLVRMFGDVPIYRKAPKTEADYNIKRDSFKDVYAFILEDLKFAEANMRLKDDQLAVNGQSIRAHRLAATALKAKVYAQIGSMLESPDDQGFGTMATGEVKPDFTHIGIASADDAWEAALEAADAVIDPQSGYALESDFRNLYRWDIAGHPEDFSSPERILVAQYTPNSDRTNYASLYTLPAFFVGTSNYKTNNSSYCNLVPSRYVFQKWAQTYGGDKGTGEMNNEIYVNCRDPRFDASFIYNIWYQYLDSDGVTPPAPGQEYVRMAGYPNNGYIHSAHWKSSPFYRKYFSPTFDVSPGHAGIYVMRLAEMYFIAAEACAWTGKNGRLGDAYDYIEVIHARARKSVDGEEADVPRWTRGQYGDGEELVSAIFWEKMFEMCGEGHEWYDTHRYGGNWIIKNIYYPIHDFLLLPEQNTENASGQSYNMLWWYQTGQRLPLTLNSARASLLCEYPEYELIYNTSLDEGDQNFFNHSKGDFFGQAGNVSGGGSNSGFGDYDEGEDGFFGKPEDPDRTGNNTKFDDSYEFNW